ncbi:MAG TPA: lytic transglycosylase domain-containing protein [Thermoanaerobaculia bacterium]
MKRRVITLVLLAALVLFGVLAFVLSRQRIQRHRVFRTAPAEIRRKAPAAEVKPVEQWTDEFFALETSGRWADLDELLERLQKSHADLYARYQLAYLHARAMIENNEPRKAMQKLAPFLAAGHPLRDLALFHQSEIDDARNEHASASQFRQSLIFGYPTSLHRDEAIDDETEYLARGSNPKPLMDFAARIVPSASTGRRRDLEAHTVEMLVRSNGIAALQRGIALLRAGTLDDPADRVSRALDRAELIRRLPADQLVILGDAFRNHRHFDRAVAVLSAALPSLPAKRDDLVFAIGRSYFGEEKYGSAQQTYMRGANSTRDMRWKATFLFHASRAVQLQGDDATAEQPMTAAVAVPGRFPATSAALTQRLRTRLKQRRFAEAASDFAALRKTWPRDHAVVEASLAYAIGMLGAGNRGAAAATLNSIPRKLLDKFEPAEVDYWRARALESSNPPAAFVTYLTVLRATVPTHFAYFTRQRLDAPAMQPKLAQELAVRDAQIAALLQKKSLDVARHVQTDRILLSSANHDAEVKRLADIYRQFPAYRAVLELTPEPFPHFPLVDNPDRLSLLLAMGLYDEAADLIPRRWPLHPIRSALTQSVAMNRGSASKESIYAVEVLMNSVPNDYLPELLPITLRRLLYPRYFYDYIEEDSKHFDADPTLVLAIMREESRFNPRAKSEAAARGLLQFIITTASEIGREIGLVNVAPEDLYDPRVIIRLGASYVSTLSKLFSGDRYRTAAAYNAGPHQVALWSRLAPASDDDFFLSSINFDETKQYVRKVMNSYRRYTEIYGNAGPQGGIRVEP